MKKLLLLTLLTILGMSTTAQAEITLRPDKTIVNKVKKIPTAVIMNNARQQGPRKITTTGLLYCPLAYYVDNEEGVDEFYVALTTVEATYDETENQMQLSGPGMILYLDLYGNNNGTDSNPIIIPSGSYSADTSHKNYTYDSEYSFVSQVTISGSTLMELTSYPSVKRNASTNAYTITADYMDGSTKKELKATDLTINFRQATDETTGHVLPQMERDILSDFCDGIGAYYGNLYNAGTGNMLVNLYTGDHDSETGYLTGEGYLVQLCLFNRLFSDPSLAIVTEGTYTKATNFAKNTYYPGTELTYAGTTAMLGCQAEYRDSLGNYTYCVITDGTVEIYLSEDSTYYVDIDMTTDDGHKVQGSYAGKIPVVDYSDDTTGTPVSTLDHDVEMNLDQITVARLYCRNEIADDSGKKYSDFILDIGSRGGLDECINNNGGDIIRMEFLTDTQWKNMLPDGEYSVLAYDYNTMYEENTMRPGYFYNGGELSGTDYQHMLEGSYLVMDEMAPIVEGSVKVQTNADDTHTITMDFYDDAGWKITGVWTGPIKLMTTYYTGISDLEQGTETPVMYDLQGRKTTTPHHGVYMMNGKKIVK